MSREPWVATGGVTVMCLIAWVAAFVAGAATFCIWLVTL